MLAEVSVAPSDELAALLKGARAGGEPRRAALQAIYARHRDEVMGFLVRLLRDHALAEDVLQEAFLRVHVNLDRFDGSRPFRPLLFEIVRNTGLDTLRRRRKAAGALPPEDEEPARPDEAASRLETSEAVGEARGVLESLPDEPRALLVQRHALGMTLEAMAQSCACTERTIRNRLRVAADQFARELLARRS